MPVVASIGRLAAALASVSMAVLLGGMAACGSSTTAKPQCQTSAQCDSASVCTKGVCLPRVNGRTLAVDVVPLNESTSAHSEFPSVTIDGTRLDLSAVDRVAADGVVVDLVRFFSGKAHLTAITPSLIPGQNDLRLEADLADYKFMLSFARNLLNAGAAVWVFPGAQTPSRPPVMIQATLDLAMGLTFPPSSTLTVIRGILHNSLDEPAPGFVTRAYVGDSVLSDVVTTDDTGMFQLQFSMDALPPDATGLITIRADPPVVIDPTTMTPTPLPRFETQPVPIVNVAGNTNQVRTFRMPAFATAAPLRFMVQAKDDPTKPIADVAVRFRTEIPALPDGRAIYETTQTTNANGEVEVPLIPGTVNSPLNYEISLTPALDSTYGARCVPALPVTMVGSGSQPQYAATLQLDSRVVLVGTVRDQGAVPAAGVTVTATPTPTSSDCANPPSTSQVSATTLRDGTYRILLDSGDYRLDIDPPIGAPLPRLTVDALSITADATNDIVLPAGEVIQGTLTASDGVTPLPSAAIRFFEVQCQDATCQGPAKVLPALRAQTRSGVDGTYSAVLPLP